MYRLEITVLVGWVLNTYNSLTSLTMIVTFSLLSIFRDIFTAWVASRGGGSTYPVK